MTVFYNSFEPEDIYSTTPHIDYPPGKNARAQALNTSKWQGFSTSLAKLSEESNKFFV